jgi:hypothetical protein
MSEGSEFVVAITRRGEDFDDGQAAHPQRIGDKGPMGPPPGGRQLQADIGLVPSNEPFDAAVGRLVLEFVPDPTRSQLH